MPVPSAARCRGLWCRGSSRTRVWRFFLAALEFKRQLANIRGVGRTRVCLVLSGLEPMRPHRTLVPALPNPHVIL